MANREIRVIGMKRSGHHAIVFWIADNVDSDEILYTGMRPGEESGIEFNVNYKAHGTPITERLLEPCWPIIYTLKSKPPVYVKSKKYGIQKFVHIGNINDILCQTSILDWDCLIFSLEDWTIDQIKQGEIEEKHDEWYGQRLNMISVLVLRDPFNLVASNLSCHQYSTPTSEVLPKMCKIWKNHAREFVGQTSFFSNCVKVNFNKWHTDKDYRLELMEELDIRLDDSPYQRIPDFGGGSSFSGKEKQGKASELKITERWKHYKDVPEFKSLLKDDELMELFREIFGTVSEEFEEWVIKEK